MPKHVKYTREALEPLVKQSVSVAQVLRLLGRPLCGGTHTHISRTIKHLGLDTSHFTGQGGSNRGKRSPARKTADEVLVNGCDHREDAFRLRRAMLEKGVEMKCVKCHIGPEYNDEPLILEIDHINNDWTDNTLTNLQFLCPNCHSQKTKTDGSKAKFLKQMVQSMSN
jgi:Zn finger protein HypA/HybF involved in hydrogenase expression